MNGQDFASILFYIILYNAEFNQNKSQAPWKYLHFIHNDYNKWHKHLHNTLDISMFLVVSFIASSEASTTTNSDVHLQNSKLVTTSHRWSQHFASLSKLWDQENTYCSNKGFSLLLANSLQQVSHRHIAFKITYYRIAAFKMA